MHLLFLQSTYSGESEPPHSCSKWVTLVELFGVDLILIQRYLFVLIFDVFSSRFSLKFNPVSLMYYSARFASAIVSSKMYWCQAHTGNWELMIVAYLKCLSSNICNNARVAWVYSGVNPQSSRINRCFDSILSISFLKASSILSVFIFPKNFGSEK